MEIWYWQIDQGLNCWTSLAWDGSTVFATKDAAMADARKVVADNANVYPWFKPAHPEFSITVKSARLA